MNLILYLLQVTCCLAFFYAFYHLTLRKETMFETNRLYLLMTLASGIALPLIKIYVDSRASDPGILLAPYVYVGSYVHTISSDLAATPNTPFPWNKLIAGIYFLGVAVMAIRLLNAIREIQWIRRTGQHTLIDGQRCVLSAKVKSPFSFLSTIYFPKHHQFGDTELKEIVAHELAHVKGRHTMDVLFMEAACILFWPSPLIYLYRKALRDVHEFVADAAVIRDTPWERYAELLVGQQQGQLQNILSNQLIYSQLKKRLRMMNQERSGFVARFKYLGIIPVVLVALVLFSFREKISSEPESNMFTNEIQSERIIHLSVAADQKIYFKLTEIPKDQLETFLRNQISQTNDTLLYVRTDKTLKVNAISEIADIGDKVKIHTVFEIENDINFDDDGFNIKSELDHQFDTLPESYVVALRTSKPNDPNDMSSFPGGASTEDLKRYGYERELPVFPGCELVPFADQGQCGMEKLGAYINGNMIYPESVRKAGVEGRVVVKFVVGADGYIKDQISITESLHPDADRVVLSLIQDMNAKVGKWMPARKEGKSVDAEMHLPVKFALSDKQTKVEPLKEVDEMARFPGCEHLTNVDERNNCAQQEMFKFVYTNIKYPKEDRDNNIEGTGVIQFVINTDGRLSDIEILRSPSEGIKAELERLMNVMSNLPDRWIPARKDGKPVPYQLILPVKFKLQDEQQQTATKSNDTSPEANTQTVKVVPNPAQESITVSIFKDTHTLKIFDTTGKLMITQKVTSSSSSNETINVSTLKPGQYVVQVISDKEALSAAFTVIQ
jgi:bla regulator protein BlaR1